MCRVSHWLFGSKYGGDSDNVTRHECMGARLAYSSDAAHNGSFPPQNPGAVVGFKLRQVPLSQ